MNKWTYEAVLDAALDYDTRTAFKHGAGSAYTTAQRNGWLPAVCAHMDEVKHRWALPEVRAEAQRYASRKAFEIGSPRAYNAARRRGLLDDVCSHMRAAVAA